MPIPLIIPILTGLGGLIAGALSRQPEINRLKKQVITLQGEITRLKGLIAEQDRQINELKLRYNAIKAYSFNEKAKMGSRVRGVIIQQYAFKEYIEFCCIQVRGQKLTESQKIVFNTYENMINNIEVKHEDKVNLRNYIVAKYEYQIDNLLPVDMNKTINILEETKVA